MNVYVKYIFPGLPFHAPEHALPVFLIEIMPWHHHDKYIVPHAAGNGFFGFYRANPFRQKHKKAISLFHSIQIIDNPEMTHIHLNQYKIFIPGFERLQQPRA